MNEAATCLTRNKARGERRSKRTDLWSPPGAAAATALTKCQSPSSDIHKHTRYPDLWPTSGGGVTVFLQQKRERTVMIMTMVYIISQCFSFYSGFSIISCNSSVVYSKYSIFICISRSGVNYAVCMSTFTLDIIIVLGMSISHLVLNIMIVCSREKKISLCV